MREGGAEQFRRQLVENAKLMARKRVEEIRKFFDRHPEDVRAVELIIKVDKQDLNEAEKAIAAEIEAAGLRVERDERGEIYIEMGTGKDQNSPVCDFAIFVTRPDAKEKNEEKKERPAKPEISEDVKRLLARIIQAGQEKKWYKVLDVTPTASEAEIKRVYRALAKQLHPDVNGSDQTFGEAFAYITAAYGVLSDDKQRRQYDREAREAAREKKRRSGFGPGTMTEIFGGPDEYDDAIREAMGKAETTFDEELRELFGPKLTVEAARKEIVNSLEMFSKILRQYNYPFAVSFPVEVEIAASISSEVKDVFAEEVLKAGFEIVPGTETVTNRPEVKGVKIVKLSNIVKQRVDAKKEAGAVGDAAKADKAGAPPDAGRVKEEKTKKAAVAADTREVREKPRTLRFARYRYGKLVQYEGGPIVKGYEHGNIGRSQDFPRELFEKFNHPNKFSFGFKELTGWDKVPWHEEGGGIVKITAEANGRSYVLCARNCGRSENDGGLKKNGRDYQVMDVVAIPLEEWSVAAVPQLVKILDTKPPTALDFNLKPLEVTTAELDKALPDNWLDDSVKEMLARVVAGEPFSVQDWKTSVKDFSEKIYYALICLPERVSQGISFGSGLGEMDGKVQIGHGQFAKGKVRKIGEAWRGEPPANLAKGERYVMEIVKRIGGCKTPREVLHAAETLPAEILSLIAGYKEEKADESKKTAAADKAPAGAAGGPTEEQIAAAVERAERAVKELATGAIVDGAEAAQARPISILRGDGEAGTGGSVIASASEAGTTVAKVIGEVKKEPAPSAAAAAPTGGGGVAVGTSRPAPEAAKPAPPASTTRRQSPPPPPQPRRTVPPPPPLRGRRERPLTPPSPPGGRPPEGGNGEPSRSPERQLWNNAAEIRADIEKKERNLEVAWRNFGAEEFYNLISFLGNEENLAGPVASQLMRELQVAHYDPAQTPENLRAILESIKKRLVEGVCTRVWYHSGAKDNPENPAPNPDYRHWYTALLLIKSQVLAVHEMMHPGAPTPDAGDAPAAPTEPVRGASASTAPISPARPTRARHGADHASRAATAPQPARPSSASRAPADAAPASAAVAATGTQRDAAPAAAPSPVPDARPAPAPAVAASARASTASAVVGGRVPTGGGGGGVPRADTPTATKQSEAQPLPSDAAHGPGRRSAVIEARHEAAMRTATAAASVTSEAPAAAAEPRPVPPAEPLPISTGETKPINIEHLSERDAKAWEIIKHYLSYTDTQTPKEAEALYKNPDTIKYNFNPDGTLKEHIRGSAEELVAILDSEPERAKLEFLIKEGHHYFDVAMEKLNFKPSRFGVSKTWLYWDITKQRYYQKHPKLSSKNYVLADPLQFETNKDSAEVLQSVLDRHIGWEFYALCLHQPDEEPMAPFYVDVNHPTYKRIEELLAEEPNQAHSLPSYELSELGKLIRENLGMADFSAIPGGGAKPPEGGLGAGGSGTSSEPKTILTAEFIDTLRAQASGAAAEKTKESPEQLPAQFLDFWNRIDWRNDRVAGKKEFVSLAKAQGWEARAEIRNMSLYTLVWRTGETALYLFPSLGNSGDNYNEEFFDCEGGLDVNMVYCKSPARVSLGLASNPEEAVRMLESSQFSLTAILRTVEKGTVNNTAEAFGGRSEKPDPPGKAAERAGVEKENLVYEKTKQTLAAAALEVAKAFPRGVGGDMVEVATEALSGPKYANIKVSQFDARNEYEVEDGIRLDSLIALELAGITAIVAPQMLSHFSNQLRRYFRHSQKGDGFRSYARLGRPCFVDAGKRIVVARAYEGDFWSRDRDIFDPKGKRIAIQIEDPYDRSKYVWVILNNELAEKDAQGRIVAKEGRHILVGNDDIMEGMGVVSD